MEARLAMVVYSCTPSTQEAETNWLQVDGLPGFIARYFLKRKKETTEQDKQTQGVQIISSP